jgi:monofunctional biosynthetic peptidoglycan transglycosylase
MAKGKKRSLGNRILRWVGLCALAFLGLSLFIALVFRWIPLPCSALMTERRVQSWSDDKPFHLRYSWVPLEKISPSMGAAVMAAEDQKFLDHFGFDWQAIEKAVAHNERSKRKRGASTLSQQTAKNVFLWERRSWVRKGLEVYFTLLLETAWSKQRILEVYLNIVEFGDGIYGVEAASKAYFGKPAKNLRPSEAALLAAVLPSPRKYKADAPSDYVRGRQAWILNQMRQMGGEQLVKGLEAK